MTYGLKSLHVEPTTGEEKLLFRNSFVSIRVHKRIINADEIPMSQLNKTFFNILGVRISRDSVKLCIKPLIPRFTTYSCMYTWNPSNLSLKYEIYKLYF